MKKILIVYSQAGGGHLSLAQALQESLGQASDVSRQLSVELIDPFPKIYASGYKSVGTSFQDLYGRNFRLTNNQESAQAIHTLNNLIIGPRLARIFKEEKPDLVISTHPFATIEVEKALKKEGLDTKIVILIADPFTPHAVWFTYQKADLYLSPTPQVTNLLVTRNIPSQRIKTIGWLVRKDFREDLPDIKGTKILRKTLGFDENKFTIFLGGGGQGGGQIFKLAKLLANSLPTTRYSQLVVVTGSNRQLLNKLARLSEKYPGLFHLFARVNNMPQLLDASDLAVGKAGPNLLFESFFREKPFLATGCLPGQEDGNLEFIKRENLGWVEADLTQAVELLSTLRVQRNLIREKLPYLQRIKKEHWDAPKKAAQEIIKLLS